MTATSETGVVPQEDLVTVTIDGFEVSVPKGTLIIRAAELIGVQIPRFCDHPLLDPVGACRQCLVDIPDAGNGRGFPKPRASCTIPVAPGMVINTQLTSPVADKAQKGVMEFLLINHPLDCPVCDKGGECPLQNQAMSNGRGESRFVERKRTFPKPLPLSSQVLLDRERCVQCARCTRFSEQIAGDPFIDLFERGAKEQVGIADGKPFSSYFSGNTVQICPVGALTAKPYRFKARPWDLSERESTCTTCSVGCRTVVQSSRDELLRYQGVDSDPVNWGWMCDRGRFNFEAVNSDRRLEAPLVRTANGLETTSWISALRTAGGLIADAVAAGGASSVGILGGARGSNEDAFAWAQLADAIGTPYRDAQLGDGLPVELLAAPRATIDDAANAATVILLGPDLKEELPVLYLRLRDSATRQRTKLIELSSLETGLSRYAWKTLRHEPGAQAAALADALDDDEIRAQLDRGDVVIVAGRQNLAESPDATMAALRTALDALPGATVLPALRRGNVVGALSLGLAPADRDHDALATLRAAAEGRLELLILLGADPLSDCPDADLARRALAGARRVIAVDTLPSASTQHADVVLAAAAYGEKAGTTTNLEGRVTTLGEQVTARGTSRPDWMIAVELGLMMGDASLPTDHPLRGVSTVGDVTELIAKTVPAFAGVSAAALAASPNGVLADPLPGALSEVSFTAPSRNSYDYRLVVSRTLYDQAVGTQMSRSLAKLAPGSFAHVNPLDLDGLGISDGDDVKVISAKATSVIAVRADLRVPRGVVWTPFNQREGTIEDIIDGSAATTDVRIERVSS